MSTDNIVNTKGFKIKKKQRITDEGWNSQKRLSDPVEKKMKEWKRRKTLGPVSSSKALFSVVLFEQMQQNSMSSPFGNYSQVPNRLQLPWTPPSLVAYSAMLVSAPVASVQNGNDPPVSSPDRTLLGGYSEAGEMKAVKASGKKRCMNERDICEDPGSPLSGPDDSGLVQAVAPIRGIGQSEQRHTLKWMAYKVDTWSRMCTSALEELPPLSFNVDADKGFNFSNVDVSFVCQKKNHFQVTVNAAFSNQPKFLKVNDELKRIKFFALHLHGIKLESDNSEILLEQSAVDRSKRPFKPHRIELTKIDNPIRVTIGRLHFSHTTENNMRKKGRPNPDQKYFSLVVGFHAYTSERESFPLVAHVSERIIVRASNPSNFEIDCDSLWIKGQEQDSIYFCGKVGINMDLPPEAFSVCGNIHLTGQVLNPSDERIKEKIRRVETAEQLSNIQKLRTYRYKYRPEVLNQWGQNESVEQVGFLAQQVRQVLPEAVHNVESNLISSVHGTNENNLLAVDKERIFVECVGAVQHLNKLISSLDNRLTRLEHLLNRSSLHM